MDDADNKVIFLLSSIDIEKFTLSLISDVDIKKHNSDEDKATVKKYNVKGFPTYVLEMVDGGVVSAPQPVNERSYDGLVNILKKVTA